MVSYVDKETAEYAASEIQDMLLREIKEGFAEETCQSNIDFNKLIYDDYVQYGQVWANVSCGTDVLFRKPIVYELHTRWVVEFFSLELPFERLPLCYEDGFIKAKRYSEDGIYRMKNKKLILNSDKIQTGFRTDIIFTKYGEDNE